MTAADMTTTTPGTKITAPSTAQLANWTLLATGVVPRTGTSIFAASGNQLAILFNAVASDGQTTAIKLTTARPGEIVTIEPAEGSKCY